MRPPATEKTKKLYFAEFTADLFDGKPRRFSSLVLAWDRWKAKDGLVARIGNNIRRIRIKKVHNGPPVSAEGGTSPVLEV